MTRARVFGETPISDSDLLEATAALDRTIAAIRGRWKCVPWRFLDERADPAVSPTGAPYIEIVSGILHTAQHPGRDIEIWCSSPAAAAQVMLDGIVHYGHAGKTLYWRIEPELNYYDDAIARHRDHFPERPGDQEWHPIRVWASYCRLLIV